MRPANVEILMGYGIGISSSYYRPTEKEILGDYLKVVDLLSVSSGDKIVLQKQVIELKEKSRDSEYLIRGKLQKKMKR